MSSTAGAAGSYGFSTRQLGSEIFFSGSDMRTPKQAVAAMLERLDDDVSYEQIVYHVDVTRAIEEGLADVEAGRTVSHEEAKQRFAECLSRAAGAGGHSPTSKTSTVG